jgi:mono/diheme cytochrome c family protein
MGYRESVQRLSTFRAAAIAAAASCFLGTIVVTQQPAAPTPAAVAAARALRNPVASTPASIAAGKKAYDATCLGCHGDRAQGADKAGTPISIIQEQGGKQPPDLTDAAFDHGGSDGEVFTVIKRGVPPTMMAGWEGVLSDTEIWHVINYRAPSRPTRTSR